MFRWCQQDELRDKWMPEASFLRLFQTARTRYTLTVQGKNVSKMG